MQVIGQLETRTGGPPTMSALHGALAAVRQAQSRHPQEASAYFEPTLTMLTNALQQYSSAAAALGQSAQAAPAQALLLTYARAKLPVKPFRGHQLVRGHFDAGSILNDLIVHLQRNPFTVRLFFQRPLALTADQVLRRIVAYLRSPGATVLGLESVLDGVCGDGYLMNIVQFVPQNVDLANDEQPICQLLASTHEYMGRCLG